MQSWVLIEDLLQIDYLWRDHENYSRELALRPQNAARILGLKADDEQSLGRIISELNIKRPTPYDKPLGDEYDGWIMIMPIAIRATRGHSEGMELKVRGCQVTLEFSLHGIGIDLPELVLQSQTSYGCW